MTNPFEDAEGTNSRFFCSMQTGSIHFGRLFASHRQVGRSQAQRESATCVWNGSTGIGPTCARAACGMRLPARTLQNLSATISGLKSNKKRIQ